MIFEYTTQSQKNTNENMQILCSTGFVWLINMSSLQDMFSSFFTLRKFTYLCLSVLLFDIILSEHLKIMIWFCMYKVLL